MQSWRNCSEKKRPVVSSALLVAITTAFRYGVISSLLSTYLKYYEITSKTRYHNIYNIQNTEPGTIIYSYIYISLLVLRVPLFTLYILYRYTVCVICVYYSYMYTIYLYIIYTRILYEVLYIPLPVRVSVRIIF